jgi:hypothetical protein
MEQARPTILEPIYSVEITAPEGQHGRHHGRSVLATGQAARHGVAGSLPGDQGARSRCPRC